MSDERLRELERRWKETGAAQDEAALLLERLRQGLTSVERLELAAHLGSEAARLLLPEAVPDPAQPPTRSLWDRLSRRGKDAEYWAAEANFKSWCDRMDGWSPQALARICLAAARTVDVSEEVEAALWWDIWQAVAQWLIAPTPDTAQACRSLRQRLVREHTRGEPPIAAAGAELIDWEDNALRNYGGSEAEVLARLLDLTLNRSTLLKPSAYGVIDTVEQIIPNGRERIREALRLDVIPWALVHSDPVEARLRKTE